MIEWEAGGTITHKADLERCICDERRFWTKKVIVGILSHRLYPFCNERFRFPLHKIGEALAKAILPNSLRMFLEEYPEVNVKIPLPAWARGVPNLKLSPHRYAVRAHIEDLGPAYPSETG